MSKIITNRRALLRAGLATAASIPLAGCQAFDFLRERDSAFREFMISFNGLTYRAQRLLQGKNALAQEFSPSDITQTQHPNGSTDPDTDAYLAIKQWMFASYQLEVD